MEDLFHKVIIVLIIITITTAAAIIIITFHFEKKRMQILTFSFLVNNVDGQIDDETADFIITQLLLLDSEDPKKDIRLLINSPGGSVTAGA